MAIKKFPIKNIDREDPLYLRIYKQAIEEGTVKPAIIISQNGWIIDGNKRHFVAEESGLPSLSPIVIPCEMDRKQAWEIHRSIPSGWIEADGGTTDDRNSDMAHIYRMACLAKKHFMAGMMLKKLNNFPWPMYEVLSEYLLSQMNSQSNGV